MFYDPAKNDHGLPYNPYKACVVPRPIGWISTFGVDKRVNLAPFSQFNNLGYDPPYVMFSAGGHELENRRKDTVENVDATGEFVFNMATYALRDAVNLSGQTIDPDVDELAESGLTPVPSRFVAPPRVAESPVHFECRLHEILVLPGKTNSTTNHVVIGRVVGVHIDDAFITAEGKVDIKAIQPIARLGYMEYAVVDTIFEMGAIDGARAADFEKAMAGEPSDPRPGEPLDTTTT